MLVIYAARAVLSHGGGLIQRVAGERLAASLRHALFIRLQMVAQMDARPAGVGAALSALTTDVGILQDAAAYSVFHALLGSIYALGGMAVCMRMSSRLMLVVAAFLLPTLWASRRARQPLAVRGRRVVRAWTDVAATAEDSLRNAAVVAAFGGASREAERCGAALDAHLSAVRSQARLEAATGAFTFYSQSVALVGVVWFGSREAARGALTAGVLVALVYYVVEVTKSVEKVVHHVSRIHAATGAAERVVRLLTEPPPPSPSKPPTPPRGPAGRGRGLVIVPPLPGSVSGAPALELRGIVFTYKNVPASGGAANRLPPAVLDGVSLSVQPGELLALVGPSGGGKSTILKIALRLLTPASGMYLLGGVDALTAPVDAVRRRLAWVPQEPVIFPGSVTENVLYGSWDAWDDDEDGGAMGRDAAVAAALLAAHASDFVAALPEGAATMLGPGGVDGGGRGLSGGQAARLCIARALIRNPLVLLLDEPSAALDAAAEHAVMTAVREHCVRSGVAGGGDGGGTACVICAHRLGPTINGSETVVVLHEGRVVESGAPAFLLARRPGPEIGMYRRMVNLQQGEGRH